MVDPTLILNDLYVIMCVYQDRSIARGGWGGIPYDDDDS